MCIRDRAYIDVSVEDGSCSVESADFVNEQEYWAGGVRPKVEIWLEADSDCYFKKSGKSAFTFTGDDVKYVSSSTKYDREMMRLVVTLDKLDEEDEDLEVSGLIWDEDNAIAHWDQNGIAKKYKVRLCRGRGGSSTEDGVGSVHTVTENSFDFAEQIPKAGNYYFKVRAVDIRDNLGDWEESPWFEVTEEDLSLIHISTRFVFDEFGTELKLACAGDMWMDCMALGVNKGNAVKTIQESLDIRPEETMAFGDQLNDLEMLDQAYYSFAVANAREEVRRAARFQADSNVNDGVLKILKYLL